MLKAQRVRRNARRISTVTEGEWETEGECRSERERAAVTVRTVLIKYEWHKQNALCNTVWTGSMRPWTGSQCNWQLYQTGGDVISCAQLEHQMCCGVLDALKRCHRHLLNYLSCSSKLQVRSVTWLCWSCEAVTCDQQAVPSNVRYTLFCGHQLDDRFMRWLPSVRPTRQFEIPAVSKFSFPVVKFINSRPIWW